MIETGLLVLVVVAGLWYAWRHRRGANQPAMDTVVDNAEAPLEVDLPQMPRIGKAGSATGTQIDELVANRFSPAPPCRDLHEYSAEEAQLLLDGLGYLRAAVAQITGEDEVAPAEIENEILAVLLADPDTREAVGRWSKAGRILPLKHSGTFSKVRDIVLRFWQPADAS